MAEKTCHVRSNSLLSRSRPLLSRLEEELNNLKSWERLSLTKETICIVLTGLRDLYNCVEDLLQLPHIQQALAYYQQQKWVEELMDGSLRLLDICGSLRDISLQMKEHLQDLQSTLRRGRIGETDSRNKYICSMKKVKKEVSKNLKRMDDKCKSSRLLDQSQDVSELIRLLKEVRVLTTTIFQSIFSFMGASAPKRKTSKWSLVSKLMNKGQVVCEMEEEKMTQKRLQELESKFEGIEEGLECIFRHLIQTRVCLLNILTC